MPYFHVFNAVLTALIVRLFGRLKLRTWRLLFWHERVPMRLSKAEAGLVKIGFSVMGSLRGK
eukprot:2559807-Amphidinium_carterae.1